MPALADPTGTGGDAVIDLQQYLDQRGAARHRRHTRWHRIRLALRRRLTWGK